MKDDGFIIFEIERDLFTNYGHEDILSMATLTADSTFVTATSLARGKMAIPCPFMTSMWSNHH